MLPAPKPKFILTLVLLCLILLAFKLILKQHLGTACIIASFLFGLGYFIINLLNNKIITLQALALFITGILVSADILLTPLYFQPWNDGHFYHTTALEIIRNKSLYCFDDVTWNKGVHHFQQPPGFRYYLASAILLLGNNQMVTAFSFLLYGAALCFFLYTTGLWALPPKVFYAIAAFAIGSAFYAAKNISMGLSEWLAIALMMVAAVNTRLWAAALLLGIVVFMRQNLLPVSILLLFFHAYRRSYSWTYIIISASLYVVIALLPLFHNLYYANEFRWAVDYSRHALFPRYERLENPIPVAIKTILQNLLHVTGWDIKSSFSTNLFAILCIIPGIVAVCMEWKLITGWQRALLILLFAVLHLPALIYLLAYYPRFEYTTLWSLVLVGLLMIKHNRGLSPVKAKKY